MSNMQRRKGRRGEQEIVHLLADLTGLDVRRTVRQHSDDSDLAGIPGWVAEVKRAKAAQPADIAAWWRQAVAQAVAAGNGQQPVLFSRIDHSEWTARWPVSALLVPECPGWWGLEWSVESTVQGFVAFFLETAPFGAGGVLASDPLPEGDSAPKTPQEAAQMLSPPFPGPGLPRRNCADCREYTRAWTSQYEWFHSCDRNSSHFLHAESCPHYRPPPKPWPTPPDLAPDAS